MASPAGKSLRNRSGSGRAAGGAADDPLVEPGPQQHEEVDELARAHRSRPRRVEVLGRPPAHPADSLLEGRPGGVPVRGGQQRVRQRERGVHTGQPRSGEVLPHGVEDIAEDAQVGRRPVARDDQRGERVGDDVGAVTAPAAADHQLVGDHQLRHGQRALGTQALDVDDPRIRQRLVERLGLDVRSAGPAEHGHDVTGGGRVRLARPLADPLDRPLPGGADRGLVVAVQHGGHARPSDPGYGTPRPFSLSLPVSAKTARSLGDTVHGAATQIRSRRSWSSIGASMSPVTRTISASG